MKDLTKIEKAFCLLKPKVREALLAWPNGWEILVDDGSWRVVGRSNLDPVLGLTYRAIPAPTDTSDYIDWSHVAEGWNYCARDEDGEAYIFPTKPALNAWSERWGATHDFLSAATHASYRRGTCDWKDSLLVRPGVEQ